MHFIIDKVGFAQNDIIKANGLLFGKINALLFKVFKKQLHI